MTLTATRRNEPVRSSDDRVPPERVKTHMVRILFEVYREHRVVLTLSLGYITIGGLVLSLLGRRWPIELTTPLFAVSWLFLSLCWLGWQFLRGPKRLRAALSGPRLVGALLVALLTIPTQITFQALKQSIGPIVGFWADPLLHHLDMRLHGGVAWHWFDWLLSRSSWIRTIDVLYTLWFIGLLLFVLWVSWSRFRQLRERALIAFLLLWIVAGTGAAGALASAGPCYYNLVVGDPNPYAELLQRLDSLETAGPQLMARRNQEGLWELRQNDNWAHFAGISAMPSLHVALVVLFALIAWRRSRLLGAGVALYAVAIQVGSVTLAWHYAIDGYLGAGLAVACWTVAGRLAKGTAPAPNPGSGGAVRIQAPL
jgi:hypothetical protein